MKREEYCSPRQLRELQEIDKKYQRKKRLSGLINKTEEHRLWRKKHPKGAWAQRQLNNAICKGTIVRGECKFCKLKKTYAHHENYNKPLEVIWLCPSCHKKYHLRLVEKQVNKKK